MAPMQKGLLLCLLALSKAARVKVDNWAGLNPVSKAVALLQGAAKSVREVGGKEEKLFAAFEKFCKKSGKELAKALAADGAQAPLEASALSDSAAQLETLRAALASAEADAEAAKEQLKDAQALRKRQAAAFKRERNEVGGSLAAARKALKGADASFLQSEEALSLQQFVDGNLLLEGREELLAFLSGAGRGEKVGSALESLSRTLKEKLQAARAAESSARKSYRALVASKQKEVKELEEAAEEKRQEISKLEGDSAAVTKSRKETALSMEEEKKLLEEVRDSCAKKKKEWGERQEMREQELSALEDTLSVLKDDDAMDLFKKTLRKISSASSAEAGAARSEALKQLQRAREQAVEERHAVDMLIMALSSDSRSFEEVAAMIDNVLGVLEEQQQSEERQRVFCERQKAVAKFGKAVNDEDIAAKRAEDSVATLTSEIAALKGGLASLEKSMKAAKEQRARESSAHGDKVTAAAAARELLGIARNRLYKFYQPEEYKEEAPALLQLGQFPKTWAGYEKQESGGIVALLSSLVKELDEDAKAAGEKEKRCAENYERLVKDGEEKERGDTAALAEKSRRRGELQAALESLTQEEEGAGKALLAALKRLEPEQCGARSAQGGRRSGEVQALKRAKDALAGREKSEA